MKEKLVTEDWRESKREATVADSFALASKQRFGLFGAPASIALGDNGEYTQTKNYKGEDGVEVGPRNFYTGNTKKFGRLRREESVNEPGFITNAVGDPYKVAQPAGMRTFQFESYLKFGQEKNWSYAKNITHTRKDNRAAYEYKEEGVGPKKKYRDETGEVISMPLYPRFAPLKKGRTATSMVIHPSGHYEYGKGDDYNAQKKLMAIELKEHQAVMDKMMGDDFRAFSCRAGRKEWKALTRGNFNTDRDILFDENPGKAPEKGVGQKYVEPKPPGAATHDLAFRPAGQKLKKLDQLNDFISKFPEYVPSPPEVQKRRVWIDTDQRGWRATTRATQGICPSVALNTRNLKSSFPNVLKR